MKHVNVFRGNVKTGCGVTIQSEPQNVGHYRKCGFIAEGDETTIEKVVLKFADLKAKAVKKVADMLAFNIKDDKDKDKPVDVIRAELLETFGEKTLNAIAGTIEDDE